MIDPWEWIGWIVLGALFGFVGLGLLLWLRRGVDRWALRWWRVWRALRTPPAKGQVWTQESVTQLIRTRLYIKRLTEDGRIVISTYHPNTTRPMGASWSDSPEEWRHRVRSRDLRLEGEWEG